MAVKEKTIVVTATFVTSLLSYLYAKEANKDSVAYVMVGGFIGSLLGEGIAEVIKKNRSDNQNMNNGNRNI
ncbi:MAG TPA: hypothetical protein PKC62_08620 [Ferruginibacter sp.]|jgi:uncharacterized membrane protein YfcA|nr:hypothetical protein [Chitinophagaceae bacterium]MBL7733471.1 hypothetical protein [Chitinophagaceae bacterium]HMT76015.1 hypothetical protein [Chitinophagaceae bacterium]HMT96735.1 hypothetical protein [Ferruginibacter sp.]HMU60120.1 hypothetical protein [Chitinophagaceae bacterium]